MSDQKAGHRSVTQLLEAWSRGEAQATEELFPRVYGELRRLARRHLRSERPGHTLGTTALVHEAYLRLVDQRLVEWQGRTHFYGIAAQAMRRILVDYARRRNGQKRGGGIVSLTLTEAGEVPASERAADFLALDDALSRLEKLDREQGRLVELRFFAGLSIEEVARTLSISPATVERRWQLARAWLFRALEGSTDGS